MRGSEFVCFDSVDLLYYNCHKLNLNRGKSYKDSPKWLRNKQSKINPKNNDDKCSEYAITIALDHKSIDKNPQITSKIKPFLNQYDWKEI